MKSLPLSRALAGLVALHALAALITWKIVAPSIQELLAPGASGTFAVMLWISVLAAPVMALLKGVLFAAIIWALLALVGRPADLSPAVRAAVTAEAALATGGLWAAGVLALRGTPASLADLAVPTGINAFIDVAAGWPTILAEQLGLFHLLWVFALGMLLQREFNTSRAFTAAIVGACWLVATTGVLIRANMLG